MSTRSAIIQKIEGGYRGIYCHFDGYPQGVGRTLIEENQYNTDDDVTELINLGDLSELAPYINNTRAYHRDFGEKWEENDPVRGKTVAEVADKIDHNGYVYVWENGSWTVNGEPLPDAVYFDEEVTPYGEITDVRHLID